MPKLHHIWDLRVERGPNCLVVRLCADGTTQSDDRHLADLLWSVLERHFTYRVVIELNEVPVLSSYLLGELIALSHRLRNHGGMIRLCGLSAQNRQILERACLEGRLPSYTDRVAATKSCTDSSCITVAR